MRLGEKHPPCVWSAGRERTFEVGEQSEVGALESTTFLHICKKKVQFVEKPALFYLEVLCQRARSEGIGPLRC